MLHFYSYVYFYLGDEWFESLMYLVDSNDTCLSTNQSTVCVSKDSDNIGNNNFPIINNNTIYFDQNSNIEMLMKPLYQKTNILLEGGNYKLIVEALLKCEQLLMTVSSLTIDMTEQNWLVLNVDRKYVSGFEPVQMLIYSNVTKYYKHIAAIHRQYGRLYLDSGDPLTALSHYGVVFDYSYKYLLMTLSPGNSTVSPEEVVIIKGELYSLISDMSNALVQLGRFDEAVYLLDRYILLNLPQDKRAYQRSLAEIYRIYNNVPFEVESWVDILHPPFALAHFLKKDLIVPNVGALKLFIKENTVKYSYGHIRQDRELSLQRISLTDSLENCIGK